MVKSTKTKWIPGFNYLTPDDVCQSYQFALALWNRKSQFQGDFGNKTLNRTREDFLMDTVQGKLAEVCFSRHSEQFGLSVRVDWKIYPNQTETDCGSDLVRVDFEGVEYICRSRVDVKAVKPKSDWLLVSAKRFTPGAYVCASLQIPYGAEQSDSVLRRLLDEGVRCDILGFCYHYDFLDNETNRPLYRFVVGDFIPGTRTQIRGGITFGLPVRALRSDALEWGELFRWLILSCARLR
jgi:hypothetical protein